MKKKKDYEYYEEEIAAIFEGRVNLLRELTYRFVNRKEEKKLKKKYYKPLTKVKVAIPKEVRKKLKKDLKSLFTLSNICEMAENKQKNFYPFRKYIIKLDLEDVPLKFRPYVFNLKKVKRYKIYTVNIDGNLYIVVENWKFGLGKIQWLLQLPKNWERMSPEKLYNKLVSPKNLKIIFFQTSFIALVRMNLYIWYVYIRYKYIGWKILLSVSILYQQAVKAYNLGDYELYQTNIAAIAKVYKILERTSAYRWVLEAIEERLNKCEEDLLKEDEEEDEE